MNSILIKKGGVISLSFFYAVTACDANERASIDLGTGFQRVSYAETNASSVQLNKEGGLLPAIFVRAGLRVKDLHFFAQGNYAHSEIDYTGHTQSFQALETTTDTTRSDFSIGLGYQVNYWLKLFSSVSQYNWDREIQGTVSSLPLDEYYRWKTATFGLNIRLFKRYLDQLTLDLNYGHYFDESLEVDLSRFGYGKPLIPLEGSGYLQYELKYAYCMTSRTDIMLKLGYTLLEFDQSETVSVSNGFTRISIREPESRTGLFQFGVGVSFRF